MDGEAHVGLSEALDLLLPGEPLPFPVFDALGRLLLNQGQAIVSERQLAQLLERGARVERALVDGLRAARGSARVAAAAPALTLFDRWEQVCWDLDDLGRRLLRGQAGGVLFEALSERLVTLLETDADIALFMAVRQDDRRFALYAQTHGVHCAVVAALVAQQLGWAPPRVRSLVAAALTMNVAIAELQAVLAEQHEPPGARQLAQIRAHPAEGVALLQRAGVGDAEWLAAVHDHHEQADGSGYPRQISTPGEAAQLLQLVDVYMAKLSPRASRPALPAQQAARQLFQQHPGSPGVAALIRALGVHPPGSLVQLQTGEVGVVVRRHGAGSAPLVAVVSNRQAEPVPGTVQRDTGQAGQAVSGPFVPAAGSDAFRRILPERVYGLVRA